MPRSVPEWVGAHPDTKRHPLRSNALRKAARGQRCVLGLPGICNFNPETVVLAHLRDETFGRGIKADDTSGLHLCSDCHRAVDEHTHGLSDGELYPLLLRALQRTIRRLTIMQVIIVPLDTPKAAKPVQRKPKGQRAAIVNRGFDKSKSRRMDGTVVSRKTERQEQ